MEAPYLDYLQAPLQPLMDNLESQTYETFEKDPVKYEQYREAVVLALRDFVHTRTSPPAPLAGTAAGPAMSHAQPTAQPTAPVPDAPTTDAPPPPPPGSAAADEKGAAAKAEPAADAAAPLSREVEVVLMVVGAGRGPLVRASLQAGAQVAAELAAAPKPPGAPAVALVLRVFAVEKNPNAVVTLRALVAREKWTHVTVRASGPRVEKSVGGVSPTSQTHARPAHCC